MAGRFRRLMPPVALFLGLLIFGITLLALGTGASDEGSHPLDAASLTSANGSALLVYPVDYFGYHTERIEVAYQFPQERGDAYFVECDDVAAMMEGASPTEPLLAFTDLRDGAFVVSHQTLPPLPRYWTLDQESGLRVCDPAVVFQWPLGGEAVEVNRPQASVVYHSASLDGESFFFLAIFMGASALLALLGGLAWIGARRGVEPPPRDGGTLETLRASLDRMGVQLERNRKTLLLAGILGVFLWYPFLVPWAWQQAAHSSDDPLVPWGVAGMTLLFLLVLTLLWGREFLRLDRELEAWRGRLGTLRDREETLMATLEDEGR